MADRIPIEFLGAIKNLVVSVNAFLRADDGCDDHRIVAMASGVAAVLEEARKVPALNDWADAQGNS